MDARGTTSVPPKVIARIVEQAATEVPGIGASAGGVLGLGGRRDFDARPSAEAEIYGDVVVLKLNVGIAYPTSLASALTGLREHVSARVQQLTGLTAARIDIDVSWLHSAGRGRRELR